MDEAKLDVENTRWHFSSGEGSDRILYEHALHSPQEGHRAQKPEQLRFIATGKLIGRVRQVFSSAKPVQLAIIHALEKQRVDVADFFGNNLGDRLYKSMAKAECKLDTGSQKIVLARLKQGPFHLPLPLSK